MILTMIKFFVEGKVETQAEECYTSHNTRRLDVDCVVKIILSTDNVRSSYLTPLRISKLIYGFFMVPGTFTCLW